MSQLNQPAAAGRRDGWSDARQLAFLERLAACGDVRAACAAVGMSRESAYQLRRRDALFARAWAAARELARESCVQELACRAIDGIEEQVWYRGEVVGTRRRYDSRLLLAHLARLDAAVEGGTAREDAGRFDELLALIAGAEPPLEVVCDESGVPISRAESATLAMEVAVELAREGDGADSGPRELSPAEEVAAGIEAVSHWDAWVETARATVDRVLAEPLDRASRNVPAWTLSGVSTSALAQAAGAGHPGPAQPQGR